MPPRWTVVLDVGKTLSKATLWNDEGELIAHRSRPNRLPTSGGNLTLDVAGIEPWLEYTLREFGALGPVGTIIPVAHGAGAAIIHQGKLQCAPLDYEWRGAALDRATYDRQRDPFAVTGSPILPAGLNLGIQLHWLESLRSSTYHQGVILPWAQYWAWLLSGEAASEVTSLGCHTDLWRPFDRRASDLALKRGWAQRLAPLRPAGSVLGTITPDWVRRTGLQRRVEIGCGLHDSNAALLAARRQLSAGQEVTVLSTGTWFVAMRTPGRNAAIPALSEARDCLVNVDVTGAPVPSARFMGGREIEMLIGGKPSPTYIDAQVADKMANSEALEAIEKQQMFLPSPLQGVGPYPKSLPSSPVVPHGRDPSVLAHLYAALIADMSLDLIGSTETLIIDGRFSQSPVFARALASLRREAQVFLSHDENGAARGALSLVQPQLSGAAPSQQVLPLPIDVTHYRATFRAAAQAAL